MNRRNTAQGLVVPQLPGERAWGKGDRQRGGRSTQKELHAIQKSMGQSGHIYIIHIIETYEENKKHSRYLIDQTRDPDMVRI